MSKRPKASQNQVSSLRYAVEELRHAYNDFNEQTTLGYINACEHIERTASIAISLWLHIHQVTSANPHLADLHVFIENAPEPVKGWLFNPFMNVFYLKTQLTADLNTLKEIGWRTDWTEAETQARLRKDLTNLSQGIAFLQKLIIPKPTNSEASDGTV